MKENFGGVNIAFELAQRRETFEFIRLCLDDLSILTRGDVINKQQIELVFRKMESRGVTSSDIQLFLVEGRPSHLLEDKYLKIYTNSFNRFLFRNFNIDSIDETMKEFSPYLVLIGMTFLLLDQEKKVSNIDFVQYLIAYYCIAGAILQYIPSKEK
jgi:hypothetical protein